MKTQEFKTTIHVPREKLWDTLWTDATYRQWTAAFTEGSYAETDWKKGSKVLFLDGKGSGMVSMIADNIPNEYMAIKHLGVVKDGVEDLESAKKEGWAGMPENYTLRSVNGGTELTVEMGIEGMDDKMLDYFKETWPKALEKLKQVAEGN